MKFQETWDAFADWLQDIATSPAGKALLGLTVIADAMLLVWAVQHTSDIKLIVGAAAYAASMSAFIVRA